MARVLEARGSDGAVCISDGTPGCLDNPLANLPSVFFHSSLSYLSVRQIVDVSVSIPGDSGVSTHVLFAHGLGSPPLLAGLILPSGQPLVGTAAVQSDGIQKFAGLTLAADAINVSIHSIRVLATAASYSLRVFVFDQVFDVAGPAPSVETLYADPMSFRASGGKLSSTKRYIQRAPLDPAFVLAGGATYFLYHSRVVYPCCGYNVAGIQHAVTHDHQQAAGPVPQAATVVGVTL